MPHPSLRDLKNLVLSLREYALNHLLIVLRPDESALLMKRVQRMTINLLSVALAVYAGLCLVFLLSQRSFIYFPTQLRQDNASAIPLQTPDATLQISTRAHDGTQALIYFGGNAEDVSYSLPEFAAAFPEKAIFMMHYRGYSGSSGRPSESALHRDAKELFKMVHAAHSDVTVIGRSLGSGVAIRLASEEPVSRLVLITPFDSILNIARRVAPFLPIELLMSDRYESWRCAPLVKAPTLILAAANDALVPAASTSSLFRAFSPGVATMRFLNGTDHNSVSETPEFMEAIQAGR